MRVLVLGAGFGGLEVTAALSEQLGADADITVIDRNRHFIFGFAKLEVMFGTATLDQVSHPYLGLARPGVRFVPTTIRAIDPVAKRVQTEAGSFDGDVIVVALGADLDVPATPRLALDGHEFYSPAGALAARDLLNGFAGGRIVVGVVATPFKCPPAPSETVLRLHDYLTARGLRTGSEIALVMPTPSPIPPVPAASEMLLAAFAERDIEWHPQRTILRLDAARREVVFGDGSRMPYDLFLAVPAHVAPPVVVQSGLAVDGWIPVDPRTLQTRFTDVYAIGDVTSAGTPKAGAFAEGQGKVVAALIAARAAGRSTDAGYDGIGICHVEMGSLGTARVGGTFVAGQPPLGRYDPPSPLAGMEKSRQVADRLHRWLGID